MTRWRVLALLCLARIGLGFQFQTVPSTGDALVGVFGLDYAGVGLLIGLFMAPGLILALPAGDLGRFIPDQRLLVLGLLAMALGGGLAGIAHQSWVVGLGRLIAGAGFVFVNLYATKIVADWFEGHEIATAMSLIVMAWPFGIAMGQVGHVWLADLFGWRMPFFVAGLYCLLAALAVQVTWRAVPAKGRDTSVSGRHLSRREWYRLLCAGVAWGLFNAGYITYLTSAPRVLEDLGEPALKASVTVSLTSWVMLFSGALCGYIADRFGRPTLILTVSMCSAVLALWLLGQPGAGWIASLLLGGLGMASAGLIMAMSGPALRPEVRAFGMGIFYTIYFAVMTVTPPLAGALLDRTGTALSPIYFAMALFAMVVPLAFGFRALAPSASDRSDQPV